jgi:ATP-dependent helicase/nuclease subunit B
VKAVLIPPEKNLIEEVATHLVAEARDYSSSLVVFPGKRPSHFLRKVLAQREGASFIPPRIFSTDEFIDFVYEELLGRSRTKLEMIDGIALLYAVHVASPNPLGGGSFLSPDRFFPLGVKIYNDIEELRIEGVAVDLVKEIDVAAGEKIPEQTALSLQRLSYFYDAFYKKAEEAGYSTRSSRYGDVARHIREVDLESFTAVIFAGFSALTRAEREIFNHLRQRENSLFLFQAGPGVDLSEWGLSEKKEGRSEGPEIQFYCSPDTHGQVFALGTLLKQGMDRGDSLDEKTVIVVPSAETLFPLLRHALCLLDPEQYNVSLGYPLLRTPLFGLLNNLTELMGSMQDDRLYVPHYLEFLLHPYIKNIYFDGRADLTRFLFHTVEAALTEKKTRKHLSLAEIEGDATLWTHIRQRVVAAEKTLTVKAVMDHLKSVHDQTIRKMLSCENVGDFAGRLREIIEYVYRSSTARLHPYFYPYAESFVSQLDLVSRSLLKDIRFEERASYFRLVKRVLATAYVPFAGTPLKGVQVLGFLETRNIQFEKVFFLDLNEGVIPNTVKEDSILPFKVRQRLGLPTYLERERILAYAFDVLTRGAREVHLFYVENGEKERSRFVEKLVWEHQKKEGKKEGTPSLRAVQYAVNLRTKIPRPVRKSDEVARFLRERTFSASSLDSYLSCPLQFYYESVLGLKERESVSEELEREEIGLFVHRVLADFFSAKQGRTLTEKDMDLRELEGLIRNRFAEQYGRDPSGEVYLLRRQMEVHLKDFMRDYQIPMIRAHRIEVTDLEKRLGIEAESFKLAARLDRIERRDGRRTIVDYKTSSSEAYLRINFQKLDRDNRETWSSAIGSLQLPFYRLLCGRVMKEDPEAIDCMFLLLGKAKIDGGIELPLFEDEAQSRERGADLEFIIFGLLREIVDPEHPFLPSRDFRKRCNKCTYTHICTN